MKKILYIILISFIFLRIDIFAQVTIGSGIKPDANALLDLKAETDGTSNKGLLLPRMALKALNSPQPITDTNLTNGMVIYNTNNLIGGNGVYYWQDNRWNIMSAGSWNVANTTQNATSNASDVYQMGKVGIGVNQPSAQLHIKPTAGNSSVKIEGLGQGVYKNNSLLSVTSDGTVQKIAPSELESAIANQTSIPVPNVYTLKADIPDFLKNETAGGSQAIMGLTDTKTAIKGMTFDATKSIIHFPPGVYQIAVVYEALKTGTCTLSSYFVDFPIGGGYTRRIHSTAAHNTGIYSNHGGVVIYTTVLKDATNWTVQLGRGQSGNCTGAGMTLIGLSTQITILRIGDAT